jgi:3-(methylthio)propanoyl-CoA dehydrogenase
MKEFNIERLFRDVRITNIYEGTSQLQVVAAIGKLLNRSLDPLFAEWQAAEYPADMAAEKVILVELTAIYQKAVDSLKAQSDRDRVDYYACDLVDMAVWLVNSWLVLRDTAVLDAKKPIARTYIASVAPRLRANGEVVMATNPVPLDAIPALLG